MPVISDPKIKVWISLVPLFARILQRARVMSQPEERYDILPTMMNWAETAAKEYKISREQIDKWALKSNQKACLAIDNGRFQKDEHPYHVII
ncbi:MAG: hypothetical protein EF806_04400 [Candidatus Methanoliparum thermophilum]|uniref:Thiolase N-terminal domain-containing protein n=1 Tax=Methanoliparum thermophilum TaxID=2491083 RepID=A0A520KS19_METT2|nr:hypothetical protein [Candidatus Methanoliparum sp. LAM-1]RZN64582.1 MAG: hypothetical protein EF806_04400 [Candidatus Methanoliparum thermophilum]BDC35813.1 hypothetical protein MTLP_04950 [Candidatus Methanoliparum sp. LAM-1]